MHEFFVAVCEERNSLGRTNSRRDVNGEMNFKEI
jgi:hypothetical protein